MEVTFDATKNGPGIWHVCHSLARVVNTQDKILTFITTLEIILNSMKCDCRDDIRAFIYKYPISDYFLMKNQNEELIGMFVWTWQLHEMVNAKLNKGSLPLNLVWDMYSPDNGNCIGCTKKTDAQPYNMEPILLKIDDKLQSDSLLTRDKEINAIKNKVNSTLYANFKY